MTEISIPKRTMGIDVGARRSHYVIGEGARGEIEVVERGKIKTCAASFTQLLQAEERMRVVIEAGGQSPWLSRLIEELGHEVIVANPRALRMIYKSRKKNDPEDARKLMELGHVSPSLLSPIQHRSKTAQADLAVLRARDATVQARTALINHVRGACASYGEPLGSCSAASFSKKQVDAIPTDLRSALTPLVGEIRRLSELIREYDQKLASVTERYEGTQFVSQVAGVGPVSTLCFVLTIEDPERFKRTRDVGAYLGLTPRQDDSGDSQKQLRISKAGDVMLRRLLVTNAQYILGPRGADCDLRRWGLKLAERGGKNAKKRAVVAVARRLSVLLLSMWRHRSRYEPLRHAEAEEKASGRQARIHKINHRSMGHTVAAASP